MLMRLNVPLPESFHGTFFKQVHFKKGMGVSFFYFCGIKHTICILKMRHFMYVLETKHLSLTDTSDFTSSFILGVSVVFFFTQVVIVLHQPSCNCIICTVVKKSAYLGQ